MKQINWIDLEADKTNINQYFDKMVKVFPKIADTINLQDEFHLKMEIFAEYSNNQIKSQNFKELTKCFDFQEKELENANEELKNAIEVSYCSTIITENEDSKLRKVLDLMKPNLLNCCQEISIYFNKTFK